MSNERAARMLTDDNVKGAPELVVEIGSAGTRGRDETIKRRLYERSGVVEYGSSIPKSTSSACIAAEQTVSSGRSN